MDHGKLTDHNGKSVDFRNVILIMTTNAGASDMAKPAMGFGSHEARRATIRRRSTGCSRRSSATVSTRSCRSPACPPEVITMVVEKFIFQLEAQLADRGVMIELSEEATKWIAEKGYDEKFGARPLGPRDPGVHQEAARGRAAVRQARARRHGEGCRRRQGRGPRARASSTSPPIRPSGPRPRARTTTTRMTSRTSRRRSSPMQPRARRCPVPRTRRSVLRRPRARCRRCRAASRTDRGFVWSQA